MRTLAVALKDFDQILHSIDWSKADVLEPEPFSGKPADIILCDSQWLLSDTGKQYVSRQSPGVILYTGSSAQLSADAVITALDPEQIISALRRVMISFNIRDANNEYFKEPGEVYCQELSMVPLDFWESILEDCSCLRSSDEYAHAAQRSGIVLGDCKYVLTLIMIYSHKAKFESWKPGTLEAVSKKLLAEILPPMDIPVIEINRTQYFTIHRIYDQSSANLFMGKCEQITSSFLDKWGMNVFALSSVPTTIDDLWRQRLRLMLEFDSFYSNIGRSAVTTVVDSVRYLVESGDNEVPSRTELASRLGFNPDYLSRIFHQQAGITLANYLDEVRLMRAKKLLADKTLTISGIASALGYRNFSSFALMFRRNTGLTPSEFRKESSRSK